MALQLPGVTEGTSYGTPALHVKKRFLARLKEDGETMAIRMEFADRDVLLELDPTVFYLTDHYRPYQAVLVRLKKAPPGLVRQVLHQAWRFQAPKALLAREGARHDAVLPKVPHTPAVDGDERLDKRTPQKRSAPSPRRKRRPRR